MNCLENEVITESSNAENTVDFRNSRGITDIGGSITDESIESNQLRKSEEWSELPSLPIENIYSFLNRNDQCRMSLVCRRWAKEYSSPAIWKTIKFYLPEHDCLSDIYPEVKFARKFGNMFKNVEVICKRVRAPLLEVICRQLKLFLNILTTNSQLISLKFVNLERYFNHLNENFFTSVFRAIVRLLESQNSLKTLEFHDCYFSPEEALELLKTVFEKSENTLRKLTLKRFVDVDLEDVNPNIDAAVNLCALMQKNLANLTTIDADYSQVFENMLPRIFDSTTKTTNKHFLSKIILNCPGKKRDRFLGIPSETWKYLRQSSPNLKVELYIIPGTHPQRAIEFFIVPGIPLKFLDIRLDRFYDNDSNLSFGGLFNHLLSCKCYEHLESLYVMWMRPIADVSSVLIPFLQACSQLKSLQLFTQHPMNGVEEMLKSWIENRPKSLEEILISVSHVGNEQDYLNLALLADEYVPLLQVLGLNTYLVLEAGW